jgi:16S rRNA processing protein RimM
MGVIGRPHGVRGLVRVTSYTADPADLVAYGPLRAADGRCFALEWRGTGIAAITEMTGDRREPVTDRKTAERLTNVQLWIERDRLPPAEDDEFYVADLVGLTAVAADGAPLGRIVAVHDYGAGVSLEIAGEEGQPMLVPFTRVSVPAIDLETGQVVISPPESIDARADEEGAA